MAATLTCPHCGEQIEISQALKHEVESQVLAAERTKHELELNRIREQLAQAQKIELQLRQQKNELDEQKRTFELDKQRTIDAEREKIRRKTAEEILESQRLKEKEKDKMIDDLKKALDEAQRKATQGSQQLQGEVQELDLEELLRVNFPGDGIEPIGKGVLGADIRQIVRSPRGVDCGTILWESKRTKAWSDSWTAKLKEDLRADKAHIPAIVSETLPEEVKSGLGLKDGVWVVSPKLALPLATLLRKSLLDAVRQRLISENRATKAEELYGYITSHEFAQQVEAMIEVYLDMKEQVGKERVAYEKFWKQREMQVNRLLNGVSGIYGSLQGIAGSALPTIKKIDMV